MSIWSRVLAAGVCSLCLHLAGVRNAAAAVADPENTAASPKLWLTRAWETDDGLPDNTVTGVAQAPDGQLWVATLGGLMRFDGERFEAFSTIQLPKVPNRVVRAMYLDRHERLWLAMDRGAVIRVDATTARAFDAADGFPDARVTSIAEDSAGGVWFVCANELCRILGNQVGHFGAPQGLPAGGNYCLAIDERGQLWFKSGARAASRMSRMPSACWPARPTGRPPTRREWSPGPLIIFTGSPPAKSASNNHGVFYDVQAVSLALFIGNTNYARSELLAARDRRIARQIEPDGKMPRELARTLSFHHSLFNLEAELQLAALGRAAGVDLWHYQTADGRSILRAVEFMAPFADPRLPWPYQQIQKPHRDELGEILLRTAAEFPASKITNSFQFYRAADYAPDTIRLCLKMADLPPR